MIPVIERKINKIRNDGSKLFLSYKTLPFDYELNVESTLKNLNQIVLELEHTYSFQKNREFLMEKPKNLKKNTIHWLLSREALLQCLQRISRLDTLAKEATIFMSISHTKTSALAACLVSKGECGLGVDIEDKKRKFNIKAVKKVFFKRELK